MSTCSETKAMADEAEPQPEPQPQPQQQQQPQTIIVMQQPMAGGAGGQVQLRDWNSGVFGCFSDFGGCE